ncbi:MAG: hypothetical protein AAF908_07770, partial [Pseudomonadota bacterium]
SPPAAGGVIRAGLLALLLVGSAAAQPIPIEPDSDPCREWQTPSRFVTFNLYMQLEDVTHTRRNKAGIWNWMHFVWRDFRPLPETALLSLQTSRRDQSVTLTSVPLIEDDFGLRRFVDQIEGMRELLIDGTPSEFETMFACSPIGYSLNSTCRLTFEVEGIIVTLSFRRTELPNWRAHKARVAKFTRCARSAARRALRADFPWTPARKAGPIGRIKASEASPCVCSCSPPFW